MRMGCADVVGIDLPGRDPVDGKDEVVIEEPTDGSAETGKPGNATGLPG